MNQSNEYTTKIILNASEAKREIDKLEKKVADLKKAREAVDPVDTKKWQALTKEIDKEEAKLKAMQGSLESINKTLKDMSVAGPKQLRDTIKGINRLLNSGNIERGSKQWNYLTDSLRQAKTELAVLNSEMKASESAWSRSVGWLNKNWGAITQIIGAVSGLSLTIRKAVNDYAGMEEAMADTRKYTGLTDEAVRDLNEDLKKIDTRTPREELNELAGAAGRLGKTSKQDIMDFVEAGDMIKVALGDDLGEGAIDKVGKLAMAFGEDKEKGLRGAMLATGSAINELAQNSSAQAGYLVDFTARVAGFGKQLGLTQAQIMGFGAVMDENLLRDEMAATAFGNMLTKMQTDTAKFAKIAGQDVKDFTKLLTEDANAAILAVADSLRSQDPQTMMKMLDDMGLDGSRAVGVLSTLADKIDDVRERQELATKAYEEGTSVGNEFDTMNNTVQARLEKVKNRFHEMTVELGERLLPVVQYTISGAGMTAKALATITKFAYENKGALTTLAIAVGLLTVAWNANTIAVKLNTKAEVLATTVSKGLAVAKNTLRLALIALQLVVASASGQWVKFNRLLIQSKALALTNPFTALATVLVTLGAAIYGATKAWKAHQREIRENLQEVKNLRVAQEAQKDVAKKVSEQTAEERTKIERLTKIIRSNAYTVDERRKAIEKLKGIVPEYHASISDEGKLYGENSKAIKEYIQNLNDAAMAEAIYAKKVEINAKRTELLFKQNKIEGSLRAVQAERDAHPERYSDRQETWVDRDGREHTTRKASPLMADSRKQEERHKQRLAETKSEQAALDAEDKFLDDLMKKNQEVSKYYTQKAVGGDDNNGKKAPTGNIVTAYESEAERKAREKKEKEEERKSRKAESDAKKERREQDKQLKAENDQRLAEELVNYSLGLTGYLQYLEKRKQIQLEGIAERKKIFEEGSAEWLRLDAKEKQLLAHGDDETRKMSLKEMERNHQMTKAMMEAQFYDEKSTLYHNEEELNEALYQEDVAFLKEKAELYQKGSLERMELEWQIEDMEEQHKLERQRTFEEQVLKIREEYLNKGSKMQMDIELNALETLHQKGLLEEEEYQRARLSIRAKYATNPAQDTKDAFSSKVSDSLSVAREKAGDANVSNPWTGDLTNYMKTNEQLKELYKSDQMTYAEYIAAKGQNLSEFLQSVVDKYQVAYQQVAAVLNAANAYSKTCSDYEVAVVEKNYEKQIAAAGNNKKKVKKLEEKKQKEISAIKSKANERAMKIEIAQAIASTAMGAINAYSSAAEVPLIGYILAPIAAAAAVAAGMLQVATIKKQHQTEALGYYSGGFTGGRQYRREAGVVHEGEFVANHQAVGNPAILPFLNFLDQAQRNNTVGSLTPQDVSQQLGTGTSAVVAPVINVQTDNEQLNGALAIVSEGISNLNQILIQGIEATVAIDGPNGLDRQYTRYQKMKNRV